VLWADPTGGSGGPPSITLLATLIGTGVALVTSVGTLLGNLAAKRREDRAARTSVEEVEVDKTRLGLEGMAQYADRLEKEITRKDEEIRQLRLEVGELRDLRDLVHEEDTSS